MLRYEYFFFRIIVFCLYCFFFKKKFINKLIVFLQVDFIWINCDQKFFEWFVGFLNYIEKEQIDVVYEEGKELEKVIEMYMYMMVVQGKMDMKGIGLQIVLDFIYKKDNRDLIIGLKMWIQVG